MTIIQSKAKRTAVVFPRHKKVLDVLGENLTLAMKRRGITQEIMHSRTGLSKPTLRKVLKGDPSVSLGHYVNVLACLGLVDDLDKVEETQDIDNPNYLKWLNMLISPDSSLSGARPKAVKGGFEVDSLAKKAGISKEESELLRGYFVLD